MLFRVSGSNKATAGRMSLEVEAESRAAAERKATSAGMIVNRIEAMGDSEPAVNRAPAGQSGWVTKLIIVAAIAAAAWFFRGQLMHLIGR